MSQESEAFVGSGPAPNLRHKSLTPLCYSRLLKMFYISAHPTDLNLSSLSALGPISQHHDSEPQNPSSCSVPATQTAPSISY